MLNLFMSCGVSLLLLAVVSPAAAQYVDPNVDPDVCSMAEFSCQQAVKERDDKRAQDDARYDAAAAAEGELRQKLLRLPPLPDESNGLLGSWRQENGGQGLGVLGSGASTGDDMVRELWETLQSNPDNLMPSRCVLTFGYGVSFAPSSYSSSALDGSRPGGSIEYRSGGEKVVWVIPDNLKPMPFKIAGPDRILLGTDGSCAMVRVGAPAANATANATAAPGDAHAAASGPSSSPASAAIPAAAAGQTRKPVDPNSALGRGVRLHGEKDFQPALQHLLSAAQQDPNDARVHVYLADTYGWLGMDAEAKQAAERAKQLDPNAFEILR